MTKPQKPYLLKKFQILHIHLLLLLVVVKLRQHVKIPNIKKFSECLDSQNHSNIVEQNDNLANSVGLQATPSFILLSTGKSQQEPLIVDGAQPYAAFQQAIAKVQSST